MNQWFRLALFSFLGIIVLNLILNLFFTPYNPYNDPRYGAGYHNNGQMMQMHGMKR